jgi:AraC family transcriptional regulator
MGVAWISLNRFSTFCSVGYRCGEVVVGDAIEQAVERAIATMRDNLGEQVTVDDMARAAMFSKFHFTRIFRQATGVSPGRFLSAMRLQRAKQLLVSTSLNVGDISVMVGYNSVGTFSSRFTRSVGLSPTTYRRLRGFTPAIATDDNRSPRDTATATVRGTIRTRPGTRSGLIFVGLFPDRIPEGRPVCCAVLAGPAPYRFVDVPPGSWYVLAHSIVDEPGADGRPGDRDDVLVGTHGPITVGLDSSIVVDLCLNPMRALDPPVLLALLDVRKLALSVHGRPEPRHATEAAPARPAA